MNKFRSLLLFCIASLSIAGFTHAYAGSRAGTLSLSLAGGYDYFASKRDIKNTSVPLGMLGYNFTNHWGFEALYGAFPTNFDNSVGDTRQIRGSLFLLDGIYHVLACYCGGMEPFVTAGVGITTLNPNRNDANNEGNVNLGVGLDLFASKSIAFRMDARDLYTIVGGKNDVLVDAGVNFLFDV